MALPPERKSVCGSTKPTKPNQTQQTTERIDRYAPVQRRHETKNLYTELL